MLRIGSVWKISLLAFGNFELETQVSQTFKTQLLVKNAIMIEEYLYNWRPQRNSQVTVQLPDFSSEPSNDSATNRETFKQINWESHEEIRWKWEMSRWSSVNTIH